MKTFKCLLILLGISLCVLVVHAGAECKDEEFECMDGKCIPKAYLCNEQKDCKDGEDEEHQWCDLKKCHEKDDKFFICDNGRMCIDRKLVCDGSGDCSDNTDELESMCSPLPDHSTHQPCKADEFQCDAKVCINSTLVCNGRKDCFDGEDESPEACKQIGSTMNSTAPICHGFLCDNNQCLNDLKWHCDGSEDCMDGSDERNCDCELANGKFLCHTEDEECIDLKDLCNSKKDCMDGSDEHENCKKDGCKMLKCENGCAELPEGPTCICKKGLKFNNVTEKCEDIDECKIYGSCSQDCVNQPGSYYCTCAPHFKLQRDNKTCQVTGDEAVLVYNTRKQIISSYLGSGLKTIVAKTRQAIGVSYDGDHFYWTDISDEKESILKYSMKTKQKEVLVANGLELPEDIAVDWLTGNIYFTDAILKHIAVCSSNGSFCTILVQTSKMQQPRAIAVYPPEGLLFWSDWGFLAHIGVAFMDGSDEKILVDQVTWPNGLAVDWPSRRLYWVDAWDRTIESVKINGEDRRVILTEQVNHPYSIAVLGSRLYWSEWETESIRSCDKFSGKKLELMASGQRFYEVHVYHKALMPSAKHGCDPNPCSHICLLGEHLKPTCACPENMQLDRAGLSCRSTQGKFEVIIAVETNLFVIPQQRFGKTEIKSVEIDQHIDCMAFNSLNGEVFIFDSFHLKIYSVDLENENVFTLVDSHVLGVSAMAFDYLANNLYWVDDVRGTVEVFSLNNKKRSILMSSIGFNEIPYSIALVPSTGEMFVALRENDHFHIDKHTMKGGEEHFHVIETDLKGPVLLDVDEVNQKLYWLDQNGRKIERSNFDGHLREFVVTSEKRTPITFAHVGSDVYWTSIGSMSYLWRGKDGNGQVNKAKLSFKKTSDHLKVIARSQLRVSNHPCMHNNGNCSDICVSNGEESRYCLCETGHFFMNGSTTTCMKRNECDFKCSSSGECLVESQRCDGTVDCTDKSDEMNCEKLKCHADQFRCVDEQQCIPIELRCDKNYNCHDKSDEEGCNEGSHQCGAHQMRCKNGNCLDLTQRCNNRDDCGDKSDEDLDECQKSCPADFFQCRTGQCVPKSSECDVHVDCHDASDEHEDCAFQVCREQTERPCPGGWCIKSKLFCDGHNDCEDGSDEIGCNSGNKTAAECGDHNEFHCASTMTCISSDKVCNKEFDCRGKEDEKNCPFCSEGEFQCHNDQCVPRSSRCDGFRDCSDGSDEENCNGDRRLPPLPTTTCSMGQFKCRDNECIDYKKVCNFKKDCTDGDDEGERCGKICEETGCEQICQATPNGAICSCNEGYKLGGNKKSCVDIDECKLSSPCSHKCTNLIGSYICSCFDGFVLDADGKFCNAMGDPAVFYYMLDDKIKNFTMKTNTKTKELTVDAKHMNINDFDVDVRREKLYFSTVAGSNLNEMDLRTGEMRIFAGVKNLKSLATDWITGNIYTVEVGETQKLRVCSMDQQICAELKKIDSHHFLVALAVDPVNKYLFYVQVFQSLDTKAFSTPTTSTIVRTRLDGSDEKPIHKNEIIMALTLDIDQKRIYFTESSTQSLIAIDYDGKIIDTFTAQNRYLREPISINVFENKAYIVNQLSSQITQCKLFGDRECHQINLMAMGMSKILIAQKSRQQMTVSMCEKHSCDAICIPADTSVKFLLRNGSEVESLEKCRQDMARIGDTPTGEAQSNDASSGSVWLWTFIILVVIPGIAFAGLYVYRRQNRFSSSNVGMHFRNGQLHGTTFDDKTMLTTVGSSASTNAGPPPTFQRHYQGFSNNSQDYSASTLNTVSLVDIIDDDDNESELMHNYETSNDTEKLIH